MLRVDFWNFFTDRIENNFDGEHVERYDWKIFAKKGDMQLMGNSDYRAVNTFIYATLDNNEIQTLHKDA